MQIADVDASAESAERIKIYTKEGFKYKIYPIDLKPIQGLDDDTVFDQTT